MTINERKYRNINHNFLHIKYLLSLKVPFIYANLNFSLWKYILLAKYHWILKYLKQFEGKFYYLKKVILEEAIHYLCQLFELKESSINPLAKNENYFPYRNTQVKKQLTLEIHLISTESLVDKFNEKSVSEKLLTSDFVLL